MEPQPTLGTGSALAAARSRHLGRWRVRIFAITWITYAAFYLTRQALAGAKLGILDDEVASAVLGREMLGVIDGLYLIAYALAQFVWGAVADRWGPRVVVLGGLLASAGAALLMGIVPALILFIPLIIVQAFAQATGWGPLLKNVSAFFPVHSRGRMLGFWSTTFAFGGLIGTPVAGWFAYELFDSWRAAFIGSAAIVFLVAIAFFILQRNSPEDAGLLEDAGRPAESDPEAAGTPRATEPTTRGRDAEPPPRARDTENAAAATSTAGAAGRPGAPAAGRGAGILAAVIAPLRIPMVLRLGLAYLLLKPARYAILFWGPVIAFEAIPSLSFLNATILPLAFGAAGVLAPIAAGWASDRLFASRRVPPAVLALAGTVAILALFMPLAGTGSVPVLVAVFALLGFFLYAADSVISAVAAVDFGTDAHAGGSAGFINGAGAIGAILGGLLPGFLDTGVLFVIFALSATAAAALLAPSWNRRPAPAPSV